MRKSLLLLLILALTTAFAVPAKTIEINFTSADLKNAPSKLDGNFFEITNSEVTLMAKGLNQNKSIGISKADKSFCVYNSTPLPNISKVEITATSLNDTKAANFIITTGDAVLTANGTNETTATFATNVLTLIPASKNNSYFRIDLSSMPGGSSNISKMVITYGESVAPETKPEKPTFSVTPGEVAKGTSVTISSKDATSLTIKSKTADATDWATKTVTGETYTVKITEAIDFEVIGIKGEGEGKLDSEAAEASYTVKADTPVPGGNITATVIFKNQTNFTYESGKNVVWVAEGYPSITFSTSATSKQNYPKKDGDNLRMYTSSSNKITVNAPEGYKIKSVSGVYTNTSNTGFKINNETTVVKSGVPYEFAEDVSSFVLVSYKKSEADKSANSTYFSSFTFVLVPDAPVVPEAPSAVTVTPAKAEAKVGENVSVTIAANGTPAPDIYYTIDGTVPTTESAKYAKAFDVTCDALANNEESKVVTINGLAQNSEGQASGSATVAFTRNDASITVKDAKGNTIGADGASLVLEDGAAEFKATSTGDGTIY